MFMNQNWSEIKTRVASRFFKKLFSLNSFNFRTEKQVNPLFKIVTVLKNLTHVTPNKVESLSIKTGSQIV